MDSLEGPNQSPADDGWQYTFHWDGVVQILLAAEGLGLVMRSCSPEFAVSPAPQPCHHSKEEHPNIGGDANMIDQTDLWWELTTNGSNQLDQWLSQFDWTGSSSS
jgi:hypothetical protein